MESPIFQTLEESQADRPVPLLMRVPNLGAET